MSRARIATTVVCCRGGCLVSTRFTDALHGVLATVVTACLVLLPSHCSGQLPVTSLEVTPTHAPTEGSAWQGAGPTQWWMDHFTSQVGVLLECLGRRWSRSWNSRRFAGVVVVGVVGAADVGAAAVGPAAAVGIVVLAAGGVVVVAPFAAGEIRPKRPMVVAAPLVVAAHGAQCEAQIGAQLYCLRVRLLLGGGCRRCQPSDAVCIAAFRVRFIAVAAR